VLIRTEASLLSVGTERMVVDFARAGFIDKARQNPERVREVIAKVKVNGLMPTIDAIQNKLGTSVPLGYCNAGVVVGVGEDVPGLSVGDRVMSNGGHAEVVLVPHRLCAKIPDGVTAEQAAWVVLAAIAMQGIRLVAPTLGETVVVTGLGPIGLLAVQLLQASGCEVLAIDLDAERCAIAEGFGATTACIGAGQDPVEIAMRLTGGVGVDAVLMTVATKSDEPVKQAAQMSRKRGRIVLVGVSGLSLDREDFFRKELTFQVSCSYGPGRYDPAYEGTGDDYPVGFVRWTENRNFQAVLKLLANGHLKVDGLITHRFDIGDAPRLYEKLGTGEKILGAVLTYPIASQVPDERLIARTVETDQRARAGGRGVLGVVGAGAFASGMLLPILAKTKIQLRTAASRGGASSGQMARKFGFARATTELDEIFDDRTIDSLLVATRHDSHADLTARAISTGRAVYVEKPLAVTDAQLAEVVKAHDEADAPLVMVGFNRRFAPMAVKMRELLVRVAEPKSLVLTINAGVLPPDHWTQHPVMGGGRIVGEGCHFIDLARYLIGHPIVGWQVSTVGQGGGLSITDDKMSMALTFADGSFAVIHYLGNGSRSFPKERIEAFAGGRVLQLDDWKSLKGWGWAGFRPMKARRQDKGHSAALGAFVDAVRKGGSSPMPWPEVLEVSQVTIAVAELARSGGGVGGRDS
jgi:predicted dehydrogenase/threonine dehydrogenase-like Zn-dependent dehydrogenase